MKTDFFSISEYWRAEVDALIKYLDAVDNTTQLFDVPLHFNFHNASNQGNSYDLRNIFEGSLLEQRPELSVTFVENHDTQSLQSLESPIEHWFKPLAFCLPISIFLKPSFPLLIKTAQPEFSLLSSPCLTQPITF